MREPKQTWIKFQHVIAQSQHLDDVMHRLGIDPLAAARLNDGVAFAAARRACLECRHERQCQRWLDASIALEAPPLFCPNAAFFALSAGSPGRSHKTTGKSC
jgi:Family of unknown function (DUF6455)